MAKLPSRLGPYDCLELLGQGSMGTVFLCYDPALDRKLVVKRMNDSLMQSMESIQRFTREARLIAESDHPNVTHIYGFWKEKGALHIAMEFIDGLTLREVLDRYGALPSPVAALVTWELLLGMRALHRLGIVHRDIKPANIMLSFSGQVKILDFGVAHFQLDRSLTTTGAIIGTTAYMAPEQCQGKDVAPQTDLFCAGITLYEATTGIHPFRAPEAAETIKNILNKKPIRPISGDYSRFLLGLIRKMLSKKILQRPRDAAWIIERMEEKTWPARDHQSILEPFMEHVRLGKPYCYRPRRSFGFKVRKGLRMLHLGVLYAVLLAILWLTWKNMSDVGTVRWSMVSTCNEALRAP